ncbi:MAG: ATP-binding cassette domain-containing protein [Elioraea sp.]|nr:ATP-binding cassette domain-containing protein [Elioraea sp.]MDW8442875.1 ATP-binding cassette domain-containing protein [Acetobacteraceae bacterium]
MRLLAPLPEERIAATAAGAVIRVAGLCKDFPTSGPVLRNVTLSVARGERVALIGPNGAGKSTLLRCLVRLVEPDQGDIVLLGEAVRALDRRALRTLRSRVGFVFQRHNLVPRLSVLSNVIHGAQARLGPRAWSHCLAPAEARAEAMACLDRVGLADLAGRRADTLSGGQSQRVAVARALMQRPAILLADEPAASLDPAAGEAVMALFADLVRQDGLTLLFTTHSLRHALDFSDRVVALQEGQIVLERLSDATTERELARLFA